VPATSPAPLHDYPYPDIWAHGIDEFDNDIAPNFAKLRRFYRAAAVNGQAVLLAIT
jgi:Domain of unknown function (DUF1877)